MSADEVSHFNYQISLSYTHKTHNYHTLLLVRILDCLDNEYSFSSVQNSFIIPFYKLLDKYLYTSQFVSNFVFFL